MKTLFLILLFVALNATADISVTNAWVNNAPLVVPVRAAYFTLTNHAKQSVSINKMLSPQFQSLEVHETVLNNGVYAMKALHRLNIPAQATLNLTPKGKHLMLMMPTQPLDALTTIQLELHTDKGQVIHINAAIKNSL